MTEDRIPHSWIGSEVVETSSGYDPTTRGIPSTLLAVTSEGMAVRYTRPGDQGNKEETAFYPWSSVYRVLKL